MRIEVIRQADDRLSQQVWVFRDERLGYSSDNVIELKLVSYRAEVRPTPRHKMRTADKWDSMDERKYYSSIARTDVPLPADVIEEAKLSVTVTFAGLLGGPST